MPGHVSPMVHIDWYKEQLADLYQAWDLIALGGFHVLRSVVWKLAAFGRCRAIFSLISHWSFSVCKWAFRVSAVPHRFNRPKRRVAVTHLVLDL